MNKNQLQNINTITYKQEFLDFIKTINFDETVHKIASFKNVFTSGAATGRFSERVFPKTINAQKNENFNALYVGKISNSKIEHDVIITRNLLSFDDYKKIIDVLSKNNAISSESFDEYMNKTFDNSWIGLSLKTYDGAACQMTTGLGIRAIADKEIEENVDGFDFKTSKTFDALNKALNHSNHMIISINILYNLNKYSILHIGLPLECSKMELKKNRIHSNIQIKSEDGRKIFKILYGGKTSNAFQRGCWVNNLEFFDKINSGIYPADYLSEDKYIP
jgi:hypothetical protein